MAESKPPVTRAAAAIVKEPPMVELKAALTSMVMSVLSARVALDQETAQVARQYQEHEILRQFAPPAFGISEVTIRLPFAAVTVDPARLPDVNKLALENLPDMLIHVGADVLGKLPQHAVAQVEMKLTQDNVSIVFNPPQ